MCSDVQEAGRRGPSRRNSESERRRDPHGRERQSARRESRRAEPVSAGPVSPQSAHRGRVAEGARFLRTRARRGRALRRWRTAAWPTRTDCSRTTACAGPADVWSKAASSAKTAVMLDDFCRPKRTRRSRSSRRRRTGIGPAPNANSSARSAWIPKYATAHHWYAASCLAPLGRLDEALDEIALAQSLDPVSSIVARDVAMIHYLRRDFETALEQCDHTIELNPHFAPAYWLLGLIQAHRRDFDESLAALQRAVHLSPQTPRMHGALGRTLRALGPPPARARGAAQTRVATRPSATSRLSSSPGSSSRSGTSTSASTGWRRPARIARSTSSLLKVDPRFDPLRDDERFAPILRQLGLE